MNKLRRSTPERGGEGLREILSHRHGRVFVLVLFLAVVGLFAMTPFFHNPITLWGWVSLPFASGIVFLAVWLIAYLIYFFKYWPFR